MHSFALLQYVNAVDSMQEIYFWDLYPTIPPNNSFGHFYRLLSFALVVGIKPENLLAKNLTNQKSLTSLGNTLVIACASCNIWHVALVLGNTNTQMVTCTLCTNYKMELSLRLRAHSYSLYIKSAIIMVAIGIIISIMVQ